MGNIMILVRNTLKVTFRKKGNIIVYLFLPILGILFSIAVFGGSGSASTNIGLIDKDTGVLSKDFARTMGVSGSYKLSVIDEKDMKSKLLDQSLNAVIVIPSGYSEGIYKESAEKMEVVSIKGQDTTVWIENFINLYTRNLLDLSTASGGDRAAFDRMYAEYRQNPLKMSDIKLPDETNSKSVTLQSMGFLIMFVMMGAGMTSQFILNEKKSRTYYRICSTPVSSREYLAANLLTSLIIVAAQVIAMQLAMKYLFRLETFVPDMLMFLILLLFGIVAIGIGMAVTSFSNSSYMAGTLSSLIITPTCMLSGCFWPVEFMPGFMQKISYFMPQRWALNAIQKMQTGGGLSDIMMNAAILLAFAAALLLVAIYKFSRSGNVQKFA